MCLGQPTAGKWCVKSGFLHSYKIPIKGSRITFSAKLSCLCSTRVYSHACLGANDQKCALASRVEPGEWFLNPLLRISAHVILVNSICCLWIGKSVNIDIPLSKMTWKGTLQEGRRLNLAAFGLSRLLSRLCSLHCHHCEDRPGIWDGSLKLLWHLDLALWSLLPNHSDKSKLFICRPCLHLSKVGQVTTAFALLHQMVSSWCIKSYQAWKQ